ncbi:hypothetical protein TrispH2_000887 [Trichoplax sp. H2]|nr:hypothetical protein TrispH2_009971 [Trichoplax sp. H2]RDD47555.1 hypothetical protein TrispH2_000887 [Trichoplax sp. H2]|eukprot:RDD39019.1 hypothetical protein TrispH2_009971 [Trichoplax sp. H2]
MPFSFLQDHHAARIFAWSIGIFGILSNLTVLWCNNKHKLVKAFSGKSLDNYDRRNQTTRKVSKVSNLLICHLAAADLLGASYLIIIASADIYYGYYHPNMFRNPISGNNIIVPRGEPNNILISNMLTLNSQEFSAMI